MPAPSIALRDATADDFEAIARLTVEAYGEFAARLAPADWARMRATVGDIAALAATGDIIIAEVAGALAGTATYCRPQRWTGGPVPTDWAAVRIVGVAPRYRGLGLGRLLTEECIDRARRDGVTTIGLHTSELNVAAREIYERIGFRVGRDLGLRLGVRYWLYRLDLRADAGLAAPSRDRD